MNVEEIVSRVMERLLAETGNAASEFDGSIPVEMSARHVHLSREHALALFGTELTPVRELSQPGQYLCKERVRLIGPKGVMDNVAVLGPARDDSQVEISLTDARGLGIEVPIRQSGDVQGTPGIVLSSGQKIIGLEEGVIVAGRHIHMSPEDAVRLNVKDRDLVCVNMEGKRPAVFRDVLVRVHPEFRLALHIDADEANGCGCDSSTRCRIVTGDSEGLCRLEN
ncbi:MAG: phosphate propanoyltransferase [Desulfobacterales bacterium]|nr:phosphate propanoyltransferase [Desulfobacterales bacterium]